MDYLKVCIMVCNGGNGMCNGYDSPFDQYSFIQQLHGNWHCGTTGIDFMCIPLKIVKWLWTEAFTMFTKAIVCLYWHQ